MANIKSEISKLALTMSGKERAKLILKDAHYRAFVDNKGFLSQSERDDLRRLPDTTAEKEYDRYKNLYDRMPVIMGVITEAYTKFKYYFETLRKAHILINYAPALEHLKALVKKGITDKNDQEEALEIIDIIDVVERHGKRITFKHPIEGIKENTRRAFEMASYFVSMKRIVDEITEALGFSPFLGKNYERVYANYIEEVGLLVKEHNDLMTKAGEDLGIKKIEDYIIPPPSTNTDAYDEWHHALFVRDLDE